MALVLKDRVRDSTTTTGTGTITLSGVAPTGYQSFGSAIGDGNTTYYTIVNGAEWEVGLGTYAAAGTLLGRTTVLASSNAGSLVNFSVGTKDVFGVYPAGKAVYANADGNVGIGVEATTNTRLYVAGVDATSSNYVFVAQDNAANNLFVVDNAGGAAVNSAPLSNTALYVVGKGTTSATYTIIARDSSGGTNLFLVRDDGRVDIPGTTVLGQGGSGNPALGNIEGWAISSGALYVSATSADALQVNRRTNDGVLVYFRQAGTAEGSISIAGTTTSYNAFMGSHWGQLIDDSKPEILKGTVMESLDEMCAWPGELPNDRLPRVKISDTVESPCVYGVFFAWDNDDVDDFDAEGNPIRVAAPTNDMYVAALGASYIRVGAGYVVTKGMLLDSAGNGCAKPQADDIVRARTICKVTSSSVVDTYPDGSYVVPCVLMCG